MITILVVIFLGFLIYANIEIDRYYDRIDGEIHDMMEKDKFDSPSKD